MTIRKSNRAHALHGSVDARQKQPAHFEKVDSIKVPSSLSPTARKAYRAIGNLLIERGLLESPDSYMLSVLSEAWSVWTAAQEHIRENGILLTAKAETRTGFSSKLYPNPSIAIAKVASTQIREASARFGLSPLDRDRLAARVDEASEDDDNDNPGNWSDAELYEDEA